MGQVRWQGHTVTTAVEPPEHEAMPEQHVASCSCSWTRVRFGREDLRQAIELHMIHTGGGEG